MHIAILLYDRLTLLDAIGPYEVLSNLPDATVQFVAKEAGSIRADSGALTLLADVTFADVVRTDVLVVPGGNSGTAAAAKDATTLDWVRAMHATSRWTTSVCTGALILGAAGLLQGLRATTYWSAGPALAQFGATYLPQRYVQEGKIITAAGVSAGIDMALFLAAEIAGVERARAIQLALEYDPQPPFDAGSPASAGPETVELARRVLRESPRQ